MNVKPSTKSLIARRTPLIVLVAGYLFCLGIFLAAGSTWFIRTDLYAKTSCSITPQSTPLVAPRRTVVLKYYPHAGAVIKEGDPLVDVITQPVSFATWTLREHLEKALAEISTSAEQSSVGLRSEVTALLARIPKSISVETLISPIDGWFLLSQPQEAPPFEPRHWDAGDCICQVATLKAATMELCFSPKGQVKLSPGETIQVLLPDYASTTLPGRLDAVCTEADVLIPLDCYPALISGISATNMTITVRIHDLEIPGLIVPSEESLRIHLELPGLGSSSFLPQTGEKVALEAPEISPEALVGTWSEVRVRVTALLNLQDAPSLLIDAISKNLSKARPTLEVANCWARVGEDRLFLRLFGK